jgi:hypothetical protein
LLLHVSGLRSLSGAVVLERDKHRERDSQTKERERERKKRKRSQVCRKISLMTCGGSLSLIKKREREQT